MLPATTPCPVAFAQVIDKSTGIKNGVVKLCVASVAQMRFIPVSDTSKP